MTHKIEIPEFLIEISKEMRTQENRCTSHPFWQVRCNRFIPTAEGYNSHHFVLVSDEGEIARSDDYDMASVAEYLEENHNDWFLQKIAEINDGEMPENLTEFFAENYEFESFNDDYDLPSNIFCVWVQEVEEIVSTHFTKSAAEAFIERKQHDYPKLYTYVESAYWSPQFRDLQDWIISLTEQE